MKTMQFDTTNFGPFTVGFDKMAEQMAAVNKQIGTVIPNYPPYNIEQTGENTYVIEMAVAGFGKSDVEITIEDDVMSIKGAVEGEDASKDFLHKGISSRNFERKYTIADQIEVKNATMLNGMLKVFLENIIPDHKKPRNVEVTGD